MTRAKNTNCGPRSAGVAFTSRRSLAAVLTVAAGMTSPALAADPTVTGQTEAGDVAGGSNPFANAGKPFRIAQAKSAHGTTGSPSALTGPRQATTPVAGAGSGGATAPTTVVRPVPPSFQNPYALADSLKLRGWNIPLPPAIDTIDQGLFGVRNKLAQNGISYFGFTDDTFQVNVLRHGLPAGNAISTISRDNQTYSGQLPTYTTADTFFVMYDLARYGIPDGQLAAAASVIGTNWNVGEPDGVNIGQLSYYQTLFNKAVEFKIGYLTENLEFLGTEVGGALGSGLFGVNAAIPFEVGQNLGGYPTPAANLTFNLPAHFYDKIGLQRGTSPDGLVEERLENKSGVRFSIPNAGALVINEAGYRVNATPGVMSTWIRAAANYTGSRYVELTNPLVRHSSNYGLYLLADRQLYQTSPGSPFTAYQGLYVGFSAMFAPNYFNVFTQYYEARLYGFGLLKGRPFDLTSIVFNRNVFSGALVHELDGFRALTHDGANTITGSYTFHVTHGTDLSLGLSYTDNPSPVTYTNNTGSSLSVLSNLFIWF